MNKNSINVSVVIPTLGKRTEELKTITSHLNGLGFEDVLVITEDGNRLYNRRFGAHRANNEWIYTQDDDVIVENVLELLKEAERRVKTFYPPPTFETGDTVVKQKMLNCYKSQINRPSTASFFLNIDKEYYE